MIWSCPCRCLGSASYLAESYTYRPSGCLKCWGSSAVQWM